MLKSDLEIDVISAWINGWLSGWQNGWFCYRVSAVSQSVRLGFRLRSTICICSVIVKGKLCPLNVRPCFALQPNTYQPCTSTVRHFVAFIGKFTNFIASYYLSTKCIFFVIQLVSFVWFLFISIFVIFLDYVFICGSFQINVWTYRISKLTVSFI